MAANRDPFLTVETRGGLLPPDFLRRLARGATSRNGGLAGLSPADYHRPGNERLNEAISHCWTRLLGAWASYRTALARLPEDDPATTVTREKWLLPLFQCLDYGRLQPAGGLEIEGRSYPVSHLWGPAPVHLLGSRVPLDTRTPGIAGAARTSPHGLVQEFLNRSGDHLWGFLSNGRRLRILRDNLSLTRLAYVEFDLEAMMEGQVYSDFVLLWLLGHQSRVEGDRPERCWLERWAREAQEQGTRALETLRRGVEDAIRALGRGFLAHPANRPLRESLRSGALDKQDYYRQLLRTVYRLLFLFVAEDRDLLLLPPAEAAVGARERYLRHYSTGRLRRLAGRRRGGPHPDLWRALRLVFCRLGDPAGCLALALPALGGHLWDPAETAALDGCDLANADLLEAIRALAYTVDGQVRQSVDYKNLGPEELGSVYEALLEHQPEMNLDAATFALTTAAGHERKTTGSYYTPTSLINALLDSALDPVLDRAAAAPDPKAAILALKVCDPACGSGHFLIAAAHRIARRLAAARTGDEEPAPEALRHALRDVIGACIYGVDLNPMALELCKVNLWLDSLEPGRPLSFLDHHLQCGNSLLGATPRLLAEGIPDVAFKPIEGDDKEVCKLVRKENRDYRRTRQATLDFSAPWDRLGDLATGLLQLEAVSDATAEGVLEKGRRWRRILDSTDYEYSRLWADAWCAAFVWPKVEKEGHHRPMTEETFRKIERNPNHVAPAVRAGVRRLAEEYRFFHWHLAFPEVFRLPGEGEEAGNEEAGWSGGFDVVLGNPPWDTLSPDAKEFFSAFDPQIRFEDRDGQAEIMRSVLAEPANREAWESYRRRLYAQAQLLRRSGRFRLFAPGNLGKGDFNVYRMFVELAMQLVRPKGWCAQVVPENFYSGPNAMAIRKELLERFELRVILGFENRREAWFTGVDSRTKFAIYAATKQNSTEAVWTRFNIQGPGELEEAKRALFRYPIRMIREFSPDALALMEFESGLDVAIIEKMYSRCPKLGEKVEGSPHRHYMREVDMGNDRGLFEGSPPGLPVYEGRMVGLYDHRAKGYRSGRGRSAVWEELPFGHPSKSIQPQWWIPEDRVPKKLAGRHKRYRLGFCDVASPTNERSLVAALLPAGSIAGDKVPTVTFADGSLWYGLAWLGLANSFAMDYLVRMKVSLKMSFTLMDSLPFPRFAKDDEGTAFLLHRVAALSCCGAEMQEALDQLAREGSALTGLEPIEDEDARLRAIAELDAFVALRIYGLTRGELDHVLESFPGAKKKDIKKYGDYRTKLLVLENYERMQNAVETGEASPVTADGHAAAETGSRPEEGDRSC